MTFSFSSILPFLPAIIIFFHKRMLRSLGYDPERARDRFSILAAAVSFLYIVTIPDAPFSLSYNLMFFLGGLIVAVPAGILSWKRSCKIKDNVLSFNDRALVRYLSLFAAIVLGGFAGYLGFLWEYVWFCAGWTTMSLALLVFLLVNYEKKLGPVILG